MDKKVEFLLKQQMNSRGQKSFSNGQGMKVQEQNSGDQKSGERKSFSHFSLTFLVNSHGHFFDSNEKSYTLRGHTLITLAHKGTYLVCKMLTTAL